jgi:hypothetical protein
MKATLTRRFFRPSPRSKTRQYVGLAISLNGVELPPFNSIEMNEGFLRLDYYIAETEHKESETVGEPKRRKKAK